MYTLTGKFAAISGNMHNLQRSVKASLEVSFFYIIIYLSIYLFIYLFIFLFCCCWGGGVGGRDVEVVHPPILGQISVVFNVNLLFL